MPTVQGYGGWKKGAPAANSSSLTEDKRKQAEYTDYLNTQSNINTGPLPTTPYGPVAVWRGPVPFGSTALTLGYAGGGPSRKSFSLGKLFSSGNNGLDLAGFSIPPPPPFTPLSISGAILWLDASDPAAAGGNAGNGATITTWRDKSGLGNNGTASGTLTINSTALNGRPTMNFTGSAWFAGSIANTGATTTIFMVMQQPASINPGGPNPDFTRVLSMAPAATNDQDPGGFLTEILTPYHTGFANGITSEFTYPVNTPYMMDVQANGTNIVAYLNGTAQLGPASTTPFNITRYRVGSMVGNNANVFTGYISEVLIYRTSLTTSDRQKIEGYLAWKWGLQASLPANHPYKKTAPVG